MGLREEGVCRALEGGHGIFPLIAHFVFRALASAVSIVSRISAENI